MAISKFLNKMSSGNNRRSPQTPVAVIMIRPHHFVPNPETQSDNAFQIKQGDDQFDIANAAYTEVSKVIDVLQSHGVRVHAFEDQTSDTPDSVFPNNWFSTHPGGQVAIYPMFAENRRKERRSDVIELLKRDYRVQDIVDYSGMEFDELFLEGTGAMVLDHIDRVAYAARSKRTDPVLLERFCTQFNYEPMVFDTGDENGTPVYHTNVLMCIATDLVLICLDMVKDQARRNELINRFRETGREIIDLSIDQIRNFAGNMLELQGREGRVLTLSTSAYSSLSADQIRVIENYLPLIPLTIPTIEMAGGSVRCMLAGVHLSPR